MKGWFVNADGIPVYFGTRADKPGLEGGHAFVALAVAGERPSELHAWNGAAWVESAALAAAAGRRATLGALAASDRDVPRVLEDLIDSLGLEADLPEPAKAKLAAKRALRAQLST
jgi:hypothetical protein